MIEDFNDKDKKPLRAQTSPRGQLLSKDENLSSSSILFAFLCG
jgi:hypothetical protein